MVFSKSRALLLLPFAVEASNWTSSLWGALEDAERWVRDTEQSLLRGHAAPSQAAGPTATSAVRSAPDPKKWDSLKQLLQGWELTENYAVAVGTAEHGRLFVYEGGHFKMTTSIPTGSTSKWPSAMMFAGLVNDGTVTSLDDLVSKYLPWWTKDPKDMRSKVTFRHLLTFTSGFGDGHPGEEANTLAARRWRQANNVSWAKAFDDGSRSSSTTSLERRLAGQVGAGPALKCNQTTGDIVECGKSIYEGVKLIGEPGKVYSYNSNHLQLAAAVAVTTTGLHIQDVIKKYLVEPYGMHNSFYFGSCPDFGGSLITTGEDYEKFLLGLLSYRTLSKELMDASEEDATPFMKDFYSLYGDYAFGHFLMCFDSVNGFTDECKNAQCHMDPGAFGFIPIIDRKNKYYFEVVAAEIPPTGSYPLSGIPEYLAIAIKPHIDAIMTGSTDPSEFFSHSPSLLSMSVADVNYCVDCKLHPKHCS